MKVAVTTVRNLENPVLEFELDLESGNVSVRLKHTCPDCAGYGCHGRGCDNTIKLTPETVVSTLGPESKEMLEKLFKQMTGE